MDALKYVIPAALGLGAAILVWRMTRTNTTTGGGVDGYNYGIRGITQGPGYGYRTISQTLISQGLQRQAFRK